MQIKQTTPEDAISQQPKRFDSCPVPQWVADTIRQSARQMMTSGAYGPVVSEQSIPSGMVEISAYSPPCGNDLRITAIVDAQNPQAAYYLRVDRHGLGGETTIHGPHSLLCRSKQAEIRSFAHQKFMKNELGPAIEPGSAAQGFRVAVFHQGCGRGGVSASAIVNPQLLPGFVVEVASGQFFKNITRRYYRLELPAKPEICYPFGRGSGQRLDKVV